MLQLKMTLRALAEPRELKFRQCQCVWHEQKYKVCIPLIGKKLSPQRNYMDRETYLVCQWKSLDVLIGGPRLSLILGWLLRTLYFEIHGCVCAPDGQMWLNDGSKSGYLSLGEIASEEWNILHDACGLLRSSSLLQDSGILKDLANSVNGCRTIHGVLWLYAGSPAKVNLMQCSQALSDSWRDSLAHTRKIC